MELMIIGRFQCDKLMVKIYWRKLIFLFGKIITDLKNEEIVGNFKLMNPIEFIYCFQTTMKWMKMFDGF